MQAVAFVFIDNSLYFEEFRNVISLSEADIKSLISNIFDDVFLGKLIGLHTVIIFSNFIGPLFLKKTLVFINLVLLMKFFHLII